MKKKKISTFTATILCKALILVFITPQLSFSQPAAQDISTQRLLLKLGSCYLNVAKLNVIDIDSGLVLAAKRTHLNPMIVIGESFTDITFYQTNKWSATEDIKSAKRLCLLSTEPNRSSLLNFIGFYYAFQPAARKFDLDSAILYLQRQRKKLKEAAMANHFA